MEKLISASFNASHFDILNSMCIELRFVRIFKNRTHVKTIIASVLAKNVTYCTNSTKLDKISVRMARTQPGCMGKFSVVVLILMFTKQKNLNLSAQLLTVLFGRQPICTTANFFSRGGSDRPYFLTFLARTQASMV